MPYFDDDGNELNPNLIPKPGLCVGCRNDDDPSQEIVCNLTRLDQQDEPEFICFAYEPKTGHGWKDLWLSSRRRNRLSRGRKLPLVPILEGSGSLCSPWVVSSEIGKANQRMLWRAKDIGVDHSTLSLRLPDSLHRNLKRAADQDGISINQFISLAVAEKLSALETYDIIAERAKGASRESLLAAMALVPKGEVVEGDELPNASSGESGPRDWATGALPMASGART
jgi:hypothetical protein